MRHILPCLAAVAALGAFADEAPHATGFRPPPFAPVLRRVEPSKTRALLRSGGDALPAKWDSREKGWISPVRNQGNVGTCWTFAAYAVLEAQLLKAGKGEHDFSEKNMANLHGFMASPNVGGDLGMAAAYLLRWGGAIAESNDVYKTTLETWTSSPMLVPEVHVQNVVKLPTLDKTDAAQELKAAITNYGAVAVSICWDSRYESTNTYYYSGSVDANHAVAVIGWDDNFPRSAFKTTAPENGAWLIKNSWGKGQGDKGYFWVSYADTKFSRDEYPTVFIPATDEENYDIVRGYDRCGYIYDVTGFYSKYFYDLQASVFTSSKNEELAAVGLYTDVYPCPYEISIYTNVVKDSATPVEGGVLACKQSGTIDHAGFATIHLTNPIPLADTNSFAVVYRQTGEYRQTIVSCTYRNGGAYYCQPTNRPGNCYVGYVTNAGTNDWMDACSEADKVDETDEGWGLCIKAYTRIANGAPKGDAPAVDDDGTQMMGELAAKKDSYLMETADTFGPLANLVGANGRSRWASWLLGLDPDDADKRDIALSIDISAGSPRISWAPRLPGRTYTLYGRDSISPASAWYVVQTNELDTTSARFFRLSIGR